MKGLFDNRIAPWSEPSSRVVCDRRSVEMHEPQDEGKSVEHWCILSPLLSALGRLAVERGWKNVLWASDTFFAWVKEPAHSEELDAWLVAVKDGAAVRLRIARDAAGTDLVPTAEEWIQTLEAELARQRAR